MKRIPPSFNFNNGENIKNLNDILQYVTGESTYTNTKFSRKFRKATEDSLKKVKGLERVKPKLKDGSLNPKVIEVLNQQFFEKKYAEKNIAGKLQQNLLSLSEKGIIKAVVNIEVEELNAKEVGGSSRKALADFQKENGLKETGMMNAETEERMEELLMAMSGRFPVKIISDAFNARNKSSVANLHKVLFELKLLDKDEAHIEVNKRRIGRYTIDALVKFQGDNNLAATGELDETTAKKLNESLVQKRYQKTEHIIGLHENLTLLKKKKFIRIDKIIETQHKNELEAIEDLEKRKTRKEALILELENKFNAEKKNNLKGATSNLLIEYFQKKYELPVNGEINVATEKKLESVASSIAGSKPRPKKQLKVKNVSELNRVVSKLRLNMSGEKVADLQRSLAWIGYKIDDEEFKNQTFGKTTRNGIIKFQEDNGLPQTGDTLNKATVIAINNKIGVANPKALTKKYRVRGSVRDELWQPKGRIRIQVFEKGLRGTDKFLGERRTFENGFYDFLYTPPIDSDTQKPKYPLNLVVKVVDDADVELASKTVFNVKQTFWVNFTDGEDYYKGESEFDNFIKRLSPSINGAGITFENIQQSDTHQDIIPLSAKTGIPPRAILLISLAHRIATSINQKNPLSAAVIYAFLRQNQPPELPSDLFPDTPNEWNEWITQLVEGLANGIAFLDAIIQEEVLKNALTENYIPRRLKPQTDAILEAFKNLRQSSVLNKPILVGDGNLTSLLDISSIDNAKYNDVATTFIKYQGVNEEFWGNLEAEAGISADEFKDFRNVTDLGIISRNHQPTVQVLKNIIDDPAQVKYNIARDFAKLSHNEWVTLINNGGGGIPDNIDGGTPADKTDFYAATLKSHSERLFPSVALVAEVERNDEHGLNHTSAVASFIYGAPEFDFKKDNLEKFNIEKGNILSNEELAEAKLVQRIHKIAPSASAGVELLNTKLHSSYQIYFYGKDRLTELLEKKNIGRIEINKLYLRAEQQYALILSKFAQFRYEFQLDHPIAIPKFIYTELELQQFKSDIPNLEVLFGSLDYCECEHCSSLYSPAAYLTDLLRFIGEKDAIPNNTTVQDILFQRRPDIKNIKLNCENTHTPLPYIDLVNEILENAIPPAQSNFSYQTTLSAEELKAIPENIRPAAYERLKNAKFPIKSSLNLWQEETRMFLQHLGVPRYQLMKTFQNRTTTPNIPADYTIAGEFFGISTEELSFITPEPNNADAIPARQQEYWGTNDVVQPSWSVEKFLEKSGLSYKELLVFLQAKFVNPDSDRSVINRPVDDCDVDKQTIDRISLAKLDRMHRFLRLWRRSNWKIWELDLLIRNAKIGNGNLDRNCLVALWKFKIIQEELGLSVEELLGFFDNLNIEIRIAPDSAAREIQPLYHRLFLNIAISNPVDEGFKLPIPDGDMTGHITTILSALAISQEDLDLLLSLTDGTLSESTLAILYRHTTLAKKLRLSIEDLLRLMKLIGDNNPFASILQTRELLQNYQSIKASGFSLLELEYILTYSPESPLGLREEVITQHVEILRVSLANLKRDLTEQNDTQRDLMDKNLSKIPGFADAEVRQTAIDLIEGIWESDNAARETFINDYFGVFISNSANPIGVLTAENFFDDDQLTQAEETAIQSRYQFVLQHLYPFLSDNSIIEQIASALSLSNQHTDIVLRKLNLSGSPEPLLKYIQTENLVSQNEDGTFLQEITVANFPEIYDVFHLTHKTASLLNRLNIETEELEWFMEHFNDVGTIDLSSLPINSADANISFDSWMNWWKLLRFKNNFPEPETISFYDILEIGFDNTGSNTELTNKLNNIFSGLSLLTKWNVSNLENIHTGLGIEFSLTNSDYAKVETYHRIWDCFKQIRLAGVDALTMLEWANKSTTLDTQQTIAKETRQAAKSKYDPNEWLKKVQPIEDELRERKRDALINYLIEWSLRTENPTIGNSPNPKYWDNSRDLFSYFLIDVEMSACQLTSRVRQSISSVQLFVQRCFLNLESRFVKIPKDDPDLDNNWSQWKWMKNYRIWEANRKVFLYPENWIEPELRDDKSPFFKELENEILQNEITHTNVEQAFLNYLQKVDEVAQLEIMGVYHDFHGPTEEFHVIGRTKTIPHIYYHRTYNLDYEYWTPWEKVEVDITGDHAIPVVYNRKLHLFWLVFNEKPEKVKKNPPAKPSNSPQDSQEPARNLEIQLAWTVKKHNGWTPKVISKEKLIHPWQRPHHSYHLKPRYKSSSNTLWVDLFVSTSEEFNRTTFYDPYLGRKKKRTRWGFSELVPPWHSSSFVFDGNIIEIKLRGISAIYRNLQSGKSEWMSSYRFVHDFFEEEGRMHKELHQSSSDYSGELQLPTKMHFKNNYLTNNTRHNPNSNKLNIITGGSKTTTLLNKARSPFNVIIPMLTPNRRPLIYQDGLRAFFVKSEWKQIMADYQTRTSINRFVFYPFYHPYTNLFIRELNRSGLDGLLNRKIQIKPNEFFPQNNFDFKNSYQPVSPNEPDQTARKDIVDFSFGGAYSIYNWELFFHAPMLIAGKLSQNQRFEEAMRWYHYIFDPTNTEDLPVPNRYWVTKPFYQHTSADYRTQRIQNIIDKIDEFSDQVAAWKNNPFKPHLIARYRPVAYQRNVVMKYIDNLIAWGDQLFRRDTMESINEASLLYMLSYELLGERPKEVPAIPRADKTFDELLAEGALDIFGNNKVEVAIENAVSLPIRVRPSMVGVEPLPRLEINYFCIPRNENLITYWDTVEDRLFKIRNCMNIEGIVRQLPLFAPPIDPALLVKAAAAGVDLSSVLNDLSVPNPNYRFRILFQSAVQFCDHVKLLGDQLLSVLEKKDVEGLSLLRASNEIKLQEAIKAVRKLQIDEAKETTKGLERNKALVIERRNYYQNIEKEIAQETAYIEHLINAGDKQQSAQSAEIIASVLAIIPNFSIGIAGFGGSPTVSLSIGGSNLSAASRAIGGSSSYDAIGERTKADKSTTQGSYERRWSEWKLQERLANKEILQIDKQIKAAEIRENIASKELSNQELVIENVKTEEEYLKNKYTNKQLYSWMISQVSSVYFQAYQLAYDMAKRAEKSFQRELGLQNSSYIQFGYWDSLKKGLLSGDKLMHDLYRMEAAYYERNRRELELTKHISLAQVDPWCLLQLRTVGECTLNIPEWLFDMDYPGHYLRRIKSVSVTIPCIAGPYTGVHCSLSLHKSQVRISNTVGANYAWNPGDFNDARFHFEMGTIQSISTSHGQTDSGLFELNFADERFLPFEGAGVVSTWGIKMPRANNQFDFSTISDVILHIQYTARNGGGNLELAAQANVDSILPTEGVRLFSLRHEFASEWHRFLYPTPANSDQELKIDLGIEHYPFFTQSKDNLSVKKLQFILDTDSDNDYNLEFRLPAQPTPTAINNIVKGSILADTHAAEHTLAAPQNGRGELSLKIARNTDTDFQSLPVDNLNDVLMIVYFEVT